MNVLVTGGAGYLGSVLVPQLVAKGHRVSVLDNFLYGTGSLDEVAGKIKVFDGDIRNMTTVVKAMADADVVIHLASIVGDQAGDLDRKTTIEINYLATKNIAELCELYGKKLIFASTCSVYGDSQEKMMREDETHVFVPLSLYGETKLRSENAIKAFDVDYAVFRMGTLFGLSPRMRFDLVINLFIAKSLNAEKLTVFGGQQYRPFIHLADAARAFVMGIEDGWKGTFNVSWKNYRLVDVATELKEKLGAEVEISTDIVDKRNYFVDTGKVRSLGFESEKDINFAVDQLRSFGHIRDYRNQRFSNFGSIFGDKEKQRKIYTLGPLGERL
ncbi:MAG: SDR family oxidoreductase [Candidatus Aenigmarchaeota archaeon]|nr:SDR family oxidoreductase [Candidatus Aenigmarchaeota archaeon]